MIRVTAENRADLLLWTTSGAIILFAHAAIAASLLLQAPSDDDSAQGAAVVMDLTALPVAPVERVEQETALEQPEEKIEKIETPSDVALLPEPKQEVPKTAEQATLPTPTVALTEGRQDAVGANLLPKWHKQIVAILERNKRYPSDARANHRQGVARVAFSMDRQGHVMSARIVASSGSPALDQEALQLTRRAEPFPPPPATLPGAEVTVTAPIRFDLR